MARGNDIAYLSKAYPSKVCGNKDTQVTHTSFGSIEVKFCVV